MLDVWLEQVDRLPHVVAHTVTCPGAHIRTRRGMWTRVSVTPLVAADAEQFGVDFGDRVGGVRFDA